jgi:hypothetical protein
VTRHERDLMVVLVRVWGSATAVAILVVHIRDAAGTPILETWSSLPGHHDDMATSKGWGGGQRSVGGGLFSAAVSH